MPPRPTSPPSLLGRLEVETPEHVQLDYELAGVGSRMSAAIVDSLLLALWGIAVLIVGAAVADAAGRMVMVIWSVVFGLGAVAYFTFFEAFRQGQTPGKRRSGIRVVMDTGHPVTFGAALLRNLLRTADLLPPPYLTGLLLVLFHPRSQRLGDLVAGTVVVRDRPDEAAVAVEAEPVAPDLPGLAGPPLSDEEWRLLTAFHERASTLDLDVVLRLERQLADRFAERFPVRPASDRAFLLALQRTESARRAAGLGAGRRGGSAAVRRLEAEGAPRWGAFERLAVRASREGLDALAAAELPDFAARYRAVAADLARARTYGAPARLLGRLERLVAAGHNLLYIDDRKTFGRIVTVVLRECPAAVVRAWRPVLLGLALLFGPAALSFATLRARPELADEVLPEVMLQRADAARERMASGLGFVEAPEELRPVLAGRIITNNVKVAFQCFAGGIFLGVGSLLALAYNGVSLGATAGHFANRGLFTYLLTFILGHGVLELFAIAVAGAAGFQLGSAVLAPGDRTRAEALKERGRAAGRMVGAVVVLLVVAGMIEGLLSASGAGFAYRVAVSSASAVFLLLYLVNGARWASTRGGP